MKRKLPLKSGAGFGRKPIARSTPSPFEAQREAARRQALNALKRARREAHKAGVTLSEWEGEFLGSVAERVETFGRAFGDPQKGAPGQALSGLQARKLKEISVKARGEAPERGPRRRLTRPSPSRSQEGEE